MNQPSPSRPSGQPVGPPPNPQPDAGLVGVRGWLLALCLMLTVVGPGITAWLMATDYTRAAPLGAQPLAVQVSVLASLLLSAGAAAFGVVAGLRLWRLRPSAPTTARQALLLGLAVDIVSTTLQVATAPRRGQSAALPGAAPPRAQPGLLHPVLCLPQPLTARAGHLRAPHPP